MAKVTDKDILDMLGLEVGDEIEVLERGKTTNYIIEKSNSYILAKRKDLTDVHFHLGFLINCEVTKVQPKPKLSYDVFNKKCEIFKNDSCENCELRNAVFTCEFIVDNKTIVETLKDIVNKDKSNKYDKAIARYLLDGIENKKIFKEDE